MYISLSFFIQRVSFIVSDNFLHDHNDGGAAAPGVKNINGGVQWNYVIALEIPIIALAAKDKTLDVLSKKCHQ